MFTPAVSVVATGRRALVGMVGELQPRGSRADENTELHLAVAARLAVSDDRGDSVVVAAHVCAAPGSVGG